MYSESVFIVCTLVKRTVYWEILIGISPVKQDAAMGIRTPVAGVKGPHDWPDYTIAASCSL
jgi:hypothetical protein